MYKPVAEFSVEFLTLLLPISVYPGSSRSDRGILWLRCHKWATTASLRFILTLLYTVIFSISTGELSNWTCRLVCRTRMCYILKPHSGRRRLTPFILRLGAIWKALFASPCASQCISICCTRRWVYPTCVVKVVMLILRTLLVFLVNN